ncbi:restriction endonuclease [Noumeavirus]|uniref:restriction endonuclease n=1 Tax=Noumeavirus TaxID=1955558 RepID=UPI000982D140|nr:restriction endonuclease [Noumeavirus]AQM72982.1 restriction endonuclease [Noumeavirus]
MWESEMNCENRKKGRLCGKEECKPCFSRSFASHEKSKYLVEGQETPLLIARCSTKKFLFGCEKCPHFFEAKIDTVSRGNFCPFCSNKQLCLSNECGICFKKSFASSDKAKFWNVEKNKERPRKVFASSGKKYWFECGECKHSFEARLDHVSGGAFCPFCSNRQLCSSNDCEICFEKSFASSDKAKFWSAEKNEKSPREVFASSNKKFWFECEKGHKFFSRPNGISAGRWCSKCKRKTEAKLFSFLEEHFKDPIYQLKVSWCKNPETDKYLLFDFCVSKTIIELDGAQHYRQISNWKSPEEQQKSDRFKEEQAIQNGYSVLRILQEDVWNDKIDWKKLLLEHVKDYEKPIVKNLWDNRPVSRE